MQKEIVRTESHLRIELRDYRKRKGHRQGRTDSTAVMEQISPFRIREPLLSDAFNRKRNDTSGRDSRKDIAVNGKVFEQIIEIGSAGKDNDIPGNGNYRG